jgi:hypothetical protein
MTTEKLDKYKKAIKLSIEKWGYLPELLPDNKRTFDYLPDEYIDRVKKFADEVGGICISHCALCSLFNPENNADDSLCGGCPIAYYDTSCIFLKSSYVLYVGGGHSKGKIVDILETEKRRLLKEKQLFSNYMYKFCREHCRKDYIETILNAVYAGFIPPVFVNATYHKAYKLLHNYYNLHGDRKLFAEYSRMTMQAIVYNNENHIYKIDVGGEL